MYKDMVKLLQPAENETYTGKERRKALERFEGLKKQRPGIESSKDIERRSWEK